MVAVTLEPGMRVRCVDRGGMTAYQIDRAAALVKGKEYLVTEKRGDSVKVRGWNQWWAEWRFKPVIRVKAGSQRV